MSTPPPGKSGDAMLLAMWTDWHDGTVSMATNDELSLEWSMLNENCYTWDDNGEYRTVSIRLTSYRSNSAGQVTR